MKVHLFLIYNIILILNTTVQAFMEKLNKTAEKLLCDQFLLDVYSLKDENAAVQKRIDTVTGAFNVTLKNQDVLAATQTATAKTLSLLFNTLTAVNNKIAGLEEKFQQLEVLDKKLNAQATQLDNQMMILQQIKEKLTKDQDQFAKINRDLASIMYSNTNLEKIMVKPSAKPAKALLLGISSANVTNS